MKKSWWFRPLLYAQESDAAAERKSVSKLLILSGILAVVVQTTLLPHFPIIPDLLLIFCVYLAIYHRSVGGAAGAFLLGYSLDSCSGAPMGMNAFAMSLIFAIVAPMTRWLWSDNPLSTLFMVFLAVVLKTGVFLLWGEWGQLTTSLPPAVVRILLQEAAAALILTPFVFFFLSRGEAPNLRA